MAHLIGLYTALCVEKHTIPVAVISLKH